MNGILNVDKPAGITSAAVVTRVKYMLLRGTKIGHAGTLDPFATGVLVVLIGRATRLCESFMSQPKQYETTIKFGATTETLDPDSPEISDANARPAELDMVQAILPKFTGTILQRPPAYSALKLDGRPAYKLARAGKAPELAPRAVEVYGIEVLGYDWPLLQLRVDCGRGTYVRSLARDIGEALGTSAYLTALRRTRVGDLWASDAVTLDTLAAEGVERHVRVVS